MTVETDIESGADVNLTETVCDIAFADAQLDVEFKNGSAHFLEATPALRRS